MSSRSSSSQCGAGEAALVSLGGGADLADGHLALGPGLLSWRLLVSLEDARISPAGAIWLSIGLLVATVPVYDWLWFRLLKERAPWSGRFVIVNNSFGLVSGSFFSPVAQLICKWAPCLAPS